MRMAQHQTRIVSWLLSTMLFIQRIKCVSSYCTKGHVRRTRWTVEGGLGRCRPYQNSPLLGRGRKQSSDDPGSLEWETFEYGDSPKWDSRFAGGRTVLAANEEELDEIRQEEADQDKVIAKKINEELTAWQSLSPDLVERATNVLRPYVNDDRVERIESVLKQRTRHTRFLFENPSNPSNVWSCLRTIDAFGIQNVDVIIQSGRYKGKAALSQKRGMRTAMGSAQWLSLRNHLSTESAIEELRAKQNCRIYASDLSPTSKDIRTIDWNEDDDDRPICIVMGNEENGISDEMRALADHTFSLPMVGFAESFNLSVATAVTLAHLSAASQSSQGPLRPGDIPEHEYNCLMLKGLLNSMPQARLGKALLRKEGIALPKEMGLV